MPKKPYPPFLLLAGIIISLSAGVLGWPSALAMGPTAALTKTGVILCLLGLSAGVSVSRQFKAYKTSIVPDHAPAAFIKDGLFAYSRNPIYVSMIMVLIGVGFLSGNGFGFLVAAGFSLWIGWRWIPLEEANMRLEFGAEFEEYCQSVRRWL